MDLILSSKKNYYTFLFLLLLLLLLPVAFYISTCSIRVYDEGRQAVNATFMHLHGNYLVTHYDGKPDLWNTKPPLLIWLQVIGLKLFGIGEFGLRVPSALAAAGTVSLLFWFGWRKLQKPLIGVLGALILISTRGYVAQHGILTGDFDALLTFFITAYSLFFFLYLETFRKRYWALITLALILGALTKSIAVLLPLPGLVVYALLSGKLPQLLKKAEVYAGMLCFLAVVAAYYYFREQVNPGYWQAVQENELGGRFLKALEEHHKPWYFYLTGDKFMPWLLLILPALWVTHQFAEGLTRRFAFFAGVFFFGFLFIISAAQTKLPWYAIPLYPLGSLLVGAGFYYGFGWLIVRYKIQQPKRFVLLSCLLVFGVFYGLVLGRVTGQPRKDKNEVVAADAYFLKDFHRQFPKLRHYTFLSPAGYNASLDFYLLRYRHKGYVIKDLRHPDNDQNIRQLEGIKPGELVLTCHPALKARLLREFEVEELRNQDICVAARIKRKK